MGKVLFIAFVWGAGGTGRPRRISLTPPSGFPLSLPSLHEPFLSFLSPLLSLLLLSTRSQEAESQTCRPGSCLWEPLTLEGLPAAAWSRVLWPGEQPPPSGAAETSLHVPCPQMATNF